MPNNVAAVSVSVVDAEVARLPTTPSPPNALVEVTSIVILSSVDEVEAGGGAGAAETENG